MRVSWKRSAVFLIVGISLLLRIIYLVEIRKSPFFLTPFGDGEYFDRWAWSIASGDFVGNEVFFKAPLYPYVLASFYKLFGHHLLIPRLLNLLFEAVSVFLVFFIAKKLWDTTAGFFAAALVACGGIFIYFSGEILGTSLAVMLGLASVNMLIYGGEKPMRWLFAGVVLSLLVLVRPNCLLLIPGGAFAIALCRASVKAKAVRISLFVAGAVPLIIICGARNYAVGKDVVLINYSGGVNFYIGNNEDSDGVSAVLPGYGNDWDEYSIAERTVGHPLKPSEVSRFWMIKGIRFIVHQPVRAFVLTVKKCYLLLNGKEISNNQNIYRFAENSRLLSCLMFLKGTRFLFFAFPSSVIIALGISGIVLSILRGKHAPALYLFSALIGISVILFFISARYRMILIAYLVPFAAFSLSLVWRNLKDRKQCALWFSLLLPLVLLTNTDPYGISMENEALESYNLGNAYFRKGELERAKAYYEKSISENPYFPRVHLNLGAVHFKAGQYDAAERAYLYEIDVNPKDGRTYHNLSLLYGQQGRLQEAIFFAREAVGRTPRFAEAQRNLGRLYTKTGKYDSAVVHLERAYDLHMRDVKTLSLLGLAYLNVHDLDRAILRYREALKLEKGDPFLWYNCGVAYIGKREFELARDHLEQAVVLQPDFAEAHFNLGMVYFELDDRENGRFHLNEALRLQPDFQEAKKMIEKTK